MGGALTGVSSVFYSPLYAKRQSGRPAVCACTIRRKAIAGRARVYGTYIRTCKLSKAVVSGRRYDAQDARRGSIWWCRQRADICQCMPGRSPQAWSRGSRRVPRNSGEATVHVHVLYSDRPSRLPHYVRRKGVPALAALANWPQCSTELEEWRTDGDAATGDTGALLRSARLDSSELRQFGRGDGARTHLVSDGSRRATAPAHSDPPELLQSEASSGRFFALFPVLATRFKPCLSSSTARVLEAASK